MLGLIGAGAYLALQSVYFIGTNSRGLVTLYQGVPYRLPGNLDLYSSHYVSGVSASTLPRRAAQTLLDHSLRSEGDAAVADPQPRTGTARMRGVRAVNRPIVAPVRARRRCCSRCWSRSPRAGRSSKRPRCAKTPSTRAPLLEQERIDRGEILAADGTVLARSVRGARRHLHARLPDRARCSRTPSATTSPNLGSTGLERYRNAALKGQTEQRTCSRVLDQLQGKKPQGDKVITTLDPAAQRVADEALGGHHGAVVALEPRTGAVTVMASIAAYDPNALRSPRRASQRVATSAAGAAVNRATQFGYAPGSTFKVVTATAAIDTGAYTPESTRQRAQRRSSISGVPLHNDDNESFGQITLTEALAHSVNTVWAQVAEQLGKRDDGALHGTLRLRPQAPARLPGRRNVRQRRVLGARTARSRRRARRSTSGAWASARTNSRSPPLQMAEVAAAVANHGRADGART